MRTPPENLASALTVLVLGTGIAVAMLLASADGRAATRFSPVFSAEFNQHWSDGKAELNGYRLTQPRYGEERSGEAVLIFVKEAFSERTRLKAGKKTTASERFEVMKLNHVEDFQTGIYDYNLMRSTFVGLQEHGGRPAGAPAKVSFSSQEWCGHVFAQLLFDQRRSRLSSHSYFDGEGDRIGSLEHPPEGQLEDSMLLWARGMSGPVLKPGGSQSVPWLLSLKRSRLLHLPLEWTTAKLQRASKSERLTVPAGVFEVDRRTVVVDGGPTFTLWTESVFPYRVIQYEVSDGEKAVLLGSKRLPYWELHQNGQEAFKKEIGL